MKFSKVAKSLGLIDDKNIGGILAYDLARKTSFSNFNKKYMAIFQSPSIEPSSLKQRGIWQNETEHSVYQRSDYSPESLEKTINDLYPPLGNYHAYTLVFNSGMAAIACLFYYLKLVAKVKCVWIGENAYFETRFIARDYSGSIFFDEYKSEIDDDCRCLWLEYPINCTRPQKYPFDQKIDIRKIVNKLLDNCRRNKTEKFYLVVDYTLGPIPYQVELLINEVPENLEIFLVTSLQKHRGYGLDLTNGGVISYYSQNNIIVELQKIRSITGSIITQETMLLMPPIKPTLIRQIILDSAINAKNIFDQFNINNNGPVKVFYSKNTDFLSSFIFIEIDKDLTIKHYEMPYLSDLLIKEIVECVIKMGLILVQGTSFGFPFCRIFKNSDRHDNTTSLRIAVGYDEEMVDGLADAFNRGIENFVKKYL